MTAAARDRAVAAVAAVGAAAEAADHWTGQAEGRTNLLLLRIPPDISATRRGSPRARKFGSDSFQFLPD
jgi:hypothetical protein